MTAATHHRPAPAWRAFTLVEMLVVVLVLTIVLTLLGTIMSGFLNAHRKMSTMLSSFDTVRMFNSQISRELGSAMVRTNQNRWLNLKVEDGTGPGGGRQKAIYFVAPDERLENTVAMNFMSHYVYFWREDEQALYRVVYNTETDPDTLKKTEAASDNSNDNANRRRLTDMTLSYRSGSPYAWTETREIQDLMDEQGLYDAILRNVFKCDILCYRDPAGTNEEGDDSWDDPTRLPRYVEFRLLVADGVVGRKARDEMATTGEISENTFRQMKTFILSVPLLNHGVKDNRIY